MNDTETIAEAPPLVGWQTHLLAFGAGVHASIHEWAGRGPSVRLEFTDPAWASHAVYMDQATARAVVRQLSAALGEVAS